MDIITNFTSTLQSTISIPTISLQLMVFFCWILVIIEEVINATKNTVYYYPSSLFGEISGLVTKSTLYAIIEGSIFRSSLVSITRNLPYFKEFNVLILGIIQYGFTQTLNRGVDGSSEYNLSKLFIRMTLGYYLVTMDNISKSIGFQILFDLTASLVVIMYKRIFITRVSLDKSFDLANGSGWVSFGAGNICSITGKVKKLKRSNSHNDIKNYQGNLLDYVPKLDTSSDPKFNYVTLKRDDLDPDLLESIDKFDKIVNEKRQIKFTKDLEKNFKGLNFDHLPMS